MRLAFSEDHQALRAVSREFLQDRCPETAVRELMESETGFDPPVWSQLGQELGLCGLTVPEHLGGVGGTVVDLGIVLEELGRSLACLPYFSSVVLTQSLLLALGDETAQKTWLPALASGELRGTVALTEPAARWDADGVTMRAVPDGAGWRLQGEKTFVLDGHTADLVLAVARSDRGIGVFTVDAKAEGLSRTALTTMDQTRKQARLEFHGAPARLVGGDGTGWPAVERMLTMAAIAISAESVGGAQAVLDASVEYAKTRVQFGRPIGSFQAIKHKCADVLLAVECARSAAYHALWAADEDDEDELRIAASMAKAYCTDAYFTAAAENVQVHGGIGFTWEHPAHLYFKRAKSNQLLFGDPIRHREILAGLVGI